MLRISNVSKSFGSQSVLDDLSIDINNSSIFGLVGINGAGKSTLLRCVSGIYKPEQGEIYFEDRDTYEDEEIRKDIFLVNDDPFFPLASTIKSLKEFYSSYYDIDDLALINYVNLFKLDVNKQINTFSKGMKRQTLLAFALAIKPKLLLLDEAFDGLDPLVRHTLKQALTDFIDENDATIIISSHNLKELEDICDSYGILSEGKISTYGDLLESKQNINKYQVAFNDDFDETALNQFNILRRSKEGSVYSLVIKGDREETIEKLSAMKPLILDTLNVNFEELFIYEQEGGDK